MAEPADETAQPRIQRIPGTNRRVRYAVGPLEPPTPEAADAAQPPERSADSTNHAWQDRDDSNDERLKRDKPPHWA